MAEQKAVWFFVGTTTRNSASEGIYVYRMDPATGAPTSVGTAPKVVDPGFLAIHPNGRFVYSVNEVADFQGKRAGGASAFTFDPVTGRMTLLNQQSAVGAGPCHISLDRTGQYAMLANYLGGSVTMLPIQKDGSLGQACDHHEHEGSSIDPQRQKKPYAHSIWPDPANRFVFAVDLGIDKVMSYKLDLAKGKLVPNDVPYVRVPAGSGPRHMDFHPNGKYAYVINELGNTVTCFLYDSARGALIEFDTVSTLPEGYTETSYCADIHVSPSGRFVYGSNRGHDSIAIFSVDQSTGRLALIGLEPTQGNFPRNFALDPSGNWLFVANQNANNIVTFRVDTETGMLSATGQVIEVPRPICIKMLPMA